MNSCFFCKETELTQIFHIEKCPIAGRFLNTPADDELLPLTILLCATCGIAQVKDFVPKEKLFKTYYYNTHAIKTLVDFFHGEANRLHKESKKMKVLEIGGNSCPLGERFSQLGHTFVNVDPSDVAKKFNPKGVELVNEFFNQASAINLKKKYGLFDVIYTANNFAHMEELHEIIRLIKELLAPGGKLTIQVQDFDYLIDELCFPFFYHEHLFYYTEQSLTYLLGRNGFSLQTTTRNSIHGQSINCTFIKSEKQTSPPDFSSLVSRIEQFTKRINQNEQQIKKHLTRIKQEGGRVFAYGASAQANIYFAKYQLTVSNIPAMIDDSPIKQGKITPYSHIPIHDGIYLKEQAPEYVLVNAYNFFDEIRSRCPWYRGTWIIPLPEVKIIKEEP